MVQAPLSRPVIGVTGGVGSGKSTVARILVELGCERIDADQIGHGLLSDPAIILALRERFGADVVRPDGTVDRQALARRAFEDEGSVAALNAIMHPPLRAELARRVEAFRAGTAPAAVLDAALLVETDWHTLCDVLVFVDAPRRSRVRSDRGWSAAELNRREKYQKPLDKKRSIAHYVVKNNSSVSHLHRQVCLLHQRLVGSPPGMSCGG
jgi:dephospho-CoA kinase